MRINSRVNIVTYIDLGRKVIRVKIAKPPGKFPQKIKRLVV